MKNIKFKRKVFEEAALTSHLTYQIGELSKLRQKSQEVKIPDIKSKSVQSVISKLKTTLKEYRRLTGKGRGIAAVQIGIPLKIAVVFLEKQILTIINPKIINKSKTLFKYPEMCMSANPVIAKVIRPSYIAFEYLDEEGNKKLWNHQDKHSLPSRKRLEVKIMNRVFQHEIDHMEGIINIDLVNSKDLILFSNPEFFENAKFETVK